MSDKKMFILNVEKSEVVHKQYESVAKILKMLKSNPNGELLISFNGYDDVVDEIYEIPAIRKWVEKMFQKFPYILYYFTELSNYENARMLIACVSDVSSMIEGTKQEAFEKAKEVYDNPSKYGLEDIPQIGLSIYAKKELVENIVKSTIAYGTTEEEVNKAKRRLSEILKNIIVV